MTPELVEEIRIREALVRASAKAKVEAILWEELEETIPMRGTLRMSSERSLV